MSELVSKFRFIEQDTEVRKHLEHLFMKGKWGQISKIPSIKTIHSSRGFPREFDCAAYALNLFGTPLLLEKLVQLQQEFYPEVDQIKSGDLILYYNFVGFGKIFNHVGRMVDSQTVRSKWNSGPIYEHPVLLVPAIFGNGIKIVREIH